MKKKQPRPEGAAFWKIVIRGDPDHDDDPDGGGEAGKKMRGMMVKKSGDVFFLKTSLKKHTSESQIDAKKNIRKAAFPNKTT